MANYLLLQNKELNDEKDEETGNGPPSPAGTKSDDSNLAKYFSLFLTVCIIAAMSFIAGLYYSSELFLNSAAFTQDVSFLSRYNLQRNHHSCEILPS